jgi:hypothetical protein
MTGQHLYLLLQIWHDGDDGCLAAHEELARYRCTCHPPFCTLCTTGPSSLFNSVPIQTLRMCLELKGCRSSMDCFSSSSASTASMTSSRKNKVSAVRADSLNLCLYNYFNVAMLCFLRIKCMYNHCRIVLDFICYTPCYMLCCTAFI